MGEFDDAAGIFHFQLGAMRDAEKTGGFLMRALADRVSDSGLSATLHRQADDTDHGIVNIEACLNDLGIAPLTLRSEVVEGMRRRFEAVVARRPTPAAMDFFAITTALQYLYYAAGTYQELTDWSEIMDRPACRERLAENMSVKRHALEHLQRLSRQEAEEFFRSQPVR